MAAESKTHQTGSKCIQKKTHIHWFNMETLLPIQPSRSRVLGAKILGPLQILSTMGTRRQRIVPQGRKQILAPLLDVMVWWPQVERIAVAGGEIFLVLIFESQPIHENYMLLMRLEVTKKVAWKCIFVSSYLLLGLDFPWWFLNMFWMAILLKFTKLGCKKTTLLAS